MIVPFRVLTAARPWTGSKAIARVVKLRAPRSLANTGMVTACPCVRGCEVIDSGRPRRGDRNIYRGRVGNCPQVVLDRISKTVRPEVSEGGGIGHRPRSRIEGNGPVSCCWEGDWNHSGRVQGQPGSGGVIGEDIDDRYGILARYNGIVSGYRRRCYGHRDRGGEGGEYQGIVDRIGEGGYIPENSGGVKDMVPATVRRGCPVGWATTATEPVLR